MKSERVFISHGTEIRYTLCKRKGHKNLTLSVRSGGKVLLTVPRYVTVGIAERFLVNNVAWLQKSIENSAPRKENIFDKEHYRKHKETARFFIATRLEELNKQYYMFNYNKVFVRCNTSRWGSCSSLRNLNFDYRILFLPKHLQDYLLIHELCHLKEMNHSNRFWALVATALPEFRALRKELRQHTLA